METQAMKTENQARKSWCPFVRHFNALFQPCGNSLAGAADGRVGTHNTCIASECMAWRWGTEEDAGLDHLEISHGISLSLTADGIRSAHQLQAMTDAEIMQIPRIGTSAKMQIRRALKTFFQSATLNQSAGYCGLAGKP